MEDYKEQDVVSAILAQAQKKDKPSSKKNGFDLKNYFAIRLEKGENSKEFQIRILPNVDSSLISPFTEVYGHKYQMPNKQWRTFLCPKEHKGEECPFCQVRQKLYESGTEADKKEARSFSVRKMYVARIIQRGKENEGIKFWRFADSYNGNGILDKITAIIKMKKTDISNPETGRDLNISINKDQNGNPVVSSILDSDAAPISDNPSLMAEWLADERTWEDVYALKNYEYLKLVIEGHDPYYDKDSGKYVSKEEYDAKKEMKSNELNSVGEIKMGGGEVTDNGKTTITQTAKLPVTEVNSTEDDADYDDDDDLPF